MDNNNRLKLEKIRHSLSHLLAYAVQELYPNVHFGIGPAIENGFYYDFGNLKICEEDLPKIEAKMRELIKQKIKFEKKEISAAQAKEIFQSQPYKLELIDELAKENNLISVYQSGNFIDLCRGPHIKSTKEIPLDAFKLEKIAGAYWRGNEKKPMLLRIYGLAFETKKSLQDFLKKQSEAIKRDHRLIGQKLELFMINEEIGIGLPIWLPKGAVVRKVIENYLYEELKEAGYQWLYTPHIASRKLWEISGHWNFYNENMYPPLEVGQSLEEVQKGAKPALKEEYLLKPMNCPFHVFVYNSKIRSYRDLPIKYAELGTVYRYERSGTLHGLTRVRGFTQDDAHLICTPEQMPKEISALVKQGVKILKRFGFKEYNIYLSTRPEKYVGSLDNWQKATATLENVLKKLKLKYQVDEGGGVFYGPKIDIKIKDSLGREWQCTTIQFDFNLPLRFKMSYVDKNNEKKEPFMIHRALLGSLERFFGVLIEHYGGNFPFWLAPVQISVIPLGIDHLSYAKKAAAELKSAGWRVELKNERETASKKIREAEIEKVPYILVIGDKEVKNKTVNVRERGKGECGEIKLSRFIKKLLTES